MSEASEPVYSWMTLPLVIHMHMTRTQGTLWLQMIMFLLTTSYQMTECSIKYRVNWKNFKEGLTQNTKAIKINIAYNMYNGVQYKLKYAEIQDIVDEAQNFDVLLSKIDISLRNLWVDPLHIDLLA